MAPPTFTKHDIRKLMNDVEEELSRNGKFDFDKYEDTVLKRLKTDANRELYEKMIDEDCDNIQRILNPQMTQSEFWDLVGSTDFRDDAALHKLVSTLDSRAMGTFPLGRIKAEDTTYGITTLPSFLKGDSKFERYRDPNGTVSDLSYPRNLLGVNTNVDVTPASANTAPPARTRKHNHSSDESVMSTDSTDITRAEQDGFCFHQLGLLQQSQSGGDYIPTGYGVVVQVSKTGKAGAIWLIYNFFPEDENGARHHLERKSWTLLEYVTGEEFTMIKVADSAAKLRDRAATYALSFSSADKQTHEVQIVGARRTGDGYIIRAYMPRVSYPSGPASPSDKRGRA